jgi:hypothetical protein
VTRQSGISESLPTPAQRRRRSIGPKTREKFLELLEGVALAEAVTQPAVVEVAHRVTLQRVTLEVKQP